MCKMIEFETKVFMLADEKDYVLQKGSVVKTKKSLCNEDWKTQKARGYGNIPKDTNVVVTGFVQNFYGEFLQVFYNDNIYSIDPRDVFYVRFKNER